MKLFVFLSEILGSKFVDDDGRVVGRLYDVPMRMSDEVYPRAAGFVIQRGLFRREFASVDAGDVKEISDVFTLRISQKDIPFQRERPRHDFTLCRDILDQQVVDTDHQKVVRVNDVHLLRIDHHFHLAHVDVGLRALVRRLEWSPLVDFIVRLLSPNSSYFTRDDFIPWKNTQILISAQRKNVLRLDVARKKLAQIPAVELTEIMEDLDIFERFSLFKSLDVQVQRKVFADLATQEKKDLVEQMEDKEAVSLIENIPADEATDLLMSLPKRRTLKLMRLVETKTSKKLRKLLGFAKDSAGGLMTTEYLHLRQDATVGEAMRLIKENANYPGNIYHLYIVDDQHRLLGSTSLRQFINADPSMPIANVCYPQKIFVRTDDGMEEIALLLEKYKFSSIPVLGEGDVLQGVITTDDVMEELISIAWMKYKEKLT